MHAVAAVFASIIAFVSGLFAPPLASNVPPDIRASQPAAAAVAQVEIIGDPFNDPDAASAVAATIPVTAPAPAFSSPPAQTVINQPVIERIIERIAPQGGMISAATLTAILADFEQSMSARIAALNPPPAAIPAQVAAGGNAGVSGFFPASQRIDQLTNIAINTPTIAGGSISGASAVGAGSGSFDALAAGTLALSGALTGTDASFSGTLSAGVLNVAGLSSQGALIGPYFTATSTTATSSFAGGLTAANGRFNILQNGYVGIGTTSPAVPLHIDAPASNTLAVMITDGRMSHAITDIGGYGSMLTLGVKDVAYDFQLSYTSETAGQIGNYQSNADNSLVFAHYNLGGSYQAENYLLGYGGYGFYDDAVGSSNYLGMYTAGSDKIGIGAITNWFYATSNPAIAVFDTLSGNVGIGSTTPWGKLSITATDNSSAPQLVVGSSTATSLFVSSNGNVGIGTANPLSTLNVAGTAGITWASAGNTLGNVTLGAAGSGGTLFVNTASLASNYASGLGVSGTFVDNPTYESTINVTAYGINANSYGSHLAFRTTLNTSVNERMRIDKNGNVGIGTTTPWGKLSIKGSGTGTGLAFAVADSANTPRFVIQDDGNVGIGTSAPAFSYNWSGLQISQTVPALRLTSTVGGGGDWQIFAESSSGAGISFYNGTDRLFITGSGNVGIGTTTPAALLSVNGTLDVNGLASLRQGATLWGGSKLTMYRSTLDSYAWSMYSDPGNTLMLTTGVGGSGTTRLSVTDSGVLSLNGLAGIGLGGATPSARLQIARPDDAFPATSGSAQSSGLVMRLGSDSQSVLDFGMHSSAGAWLQATNPVLLQINYPLLLNPNGGNVGIGTTTPWGKFSVQTSDNTSVPQLVVGSSTATSLFVGANGNVGIGTTTPSDKLHVYGDSTGNVKIGLAGGPAGSAGIQFLWQSAAYGRILGSGIDNALQIEATYAGTNPIEFFTGGSERMRITPAGNVGIGTTTPWGKLSVTGSGTGTGLAFAVADSANTPRFVIQDNGNVGIGTAAPSTKLEVRGALSGLAVPLRVDGGGNSNGDGSGMSFGFADAGSFTTWDTGRIYGIAENRLATYAGALTFYTNSGETPVTVGERMRITSAGNVGIGTTTPTAQFSTTGTVRFAGLGSGGANLVTDALGNVTASSDERLKDKQGDFTRGLVAINAISPVLYKWRPETGLDTQATYAGFFAQNVQAAIPEAVSPDSRGYLTLADRPILAALVNATKEIGTIAGAFKSSLIAWLGSASNGIGDLFAKDIYATNGAFDTTTANTTNTRELCITDGANDNAPLCLTKSQLAALLGQSAAAGLPLSVIPQAPIIELNGNASSTIEVGAAYNDLGARIVAPTSDLNLGLTIVLDGGTTTAVTIDTTTPGEHTIIYTATSPTTGLTGYATRTVIVSPVAQSTTDFGMTAPPQPDSHLPTDDAQPANDNPFNLSPSNDNPAPVTTTLAIPTAA